MAAAMAKPARPRRASMAFSPCLIEPHHSTQIKRRQEKYRSLHWLDSLSDIPGKSPKSSCRHVTG
jgi:hypothetical protein